MKKKQHPYDPEDDYHIYTMMDDQYGHFVGFAVGKRGEVNKEYKDKGYKMVGNSLMVKKRECHGRTIYKDLPIR